MTVSRVRVELPPSGDDRSYDVIIGAGLLDEAGTHIRTYLPRGKTVIITDENVARAQGKRLRRGLKAAGIEFDEIILPPGEATKSVEQLGQLLSSLLALGVERSDVVIAFGGGVIGDLVGLATALLRRGCSFIQIPTSLLAQVDSSVGGKTAVNAPEGKNLIGVFHQPKLVLADINALQTLPPREYAAGYAEVVKYAALGDLGFFDWLETGDVYSPQSLVKDPAAVTRMIETCIAAKANIVIADETERSVRQLLNLGHTFGHALEAAYGYSSSLLHGEAVAAGMGLAFDFSVTQGHCSRDHADRLKRHLQQAGLPTGLGDLPARDAQLSVSELMESIQQDKKVRGGHLTFILVRALGEAFIDDDVSPEALALFLTKAGGVST